MSKKHLSALDEYLYQLRLQPHKRQYTFERANISKDTLSYYASLINKKAEGGLGKKLKKIKNT